MKIRPAFRFGIFLGFSLHNGVEPIGKIYGQYKLAILALQGVES